MEVALPRRIGNKILVRRRRGRSVRLRNGIDANCLPAV
jgi:hypothetical protein